MADEIDTEAEWRRHCKDAEPALENLEQKLIETRADILAIEVTIAIPRDRYGTLHANLVALMRIADRQAKALEQIYGFTR